MLKSQIFLMMKAILENFAIKRSKANGFIGISTKNNDSCEKQGA